MADLTPERIAELRKLEKFATAGPWTREKPGQCPTTGFQMGVAIGGTVGRQTIYATPPGGQFLAADCNLIVAARNALPELLDEVERLKSRTRPDRVVQHDHEAVGSVTYSNCIGCIADERDAARAELAAAKDEIEFAQGELEHALGGERITLLQCAGDVARELAAVKADRDRLLSAAKAVAIIDCDPFAQGGFAAELRLRQAIEASEGGA